MSKKVCPRCKGKGTKAEIESPLFAVMTLGFTALLELSMPSRCNLCKGKGWVNLDD